MKPVIDRAKKLVKKQRVVYTEGEEPRVLHAVQTVVDEGLAYPILIGRRDVVKMRIERCGLRLKIDEDFELCDPTSDPRYKDYWDMYYKLMARQGISPDSAKVIVRTNTTVIAAIMVKRGEADAVIVGPVGRFGKHIEDVVSILGYAPGTSTVAALDVLITRAGTHFICDTQVNDDPSAQEIADITLMAAEQVRSFGIQPKIALVSHSNFGSKKSDSAQKMQKVLEIVRELAPELEIDGEIQADAALDSDIRDCVHPESFLTGNANLLIMPNLDAAHIAFNMAKVLADGEQIGPLLLGVDKPAHILSSSASSRAIVNITALAVVEVDRRSNNHDESHR